jgi:hypothetical protein
MRGIVKQQINDKTFHDDWIVASKLGNLRAIKMLKN